MEIQEKRKLLKSYKKNKIEIEQNSRNKNELILINKKIENVNNQDERIALRYVYLEGKIQEDAANEAGFSFKYFQKILSNAVKHIKL